MAEKKKSRLHAKFGLHRGDVLLPEERKQPSEMNKKFGLKRGEVAFDKSPRSGNSGKSRTR